MRRYRRDHRTFKRGHKYRTSCRQIICRGSGRSCHNKPVCHIVGKKIAVYLGMHGDCRCRLTPQHRHLIQSIRPEAFGHRFTSDFKQRALLDHPLVAGNDIYQLLCFLKRIARKKTQMTCIDAENRDLPVSNPFRGTEKRAVSPDAYHALGVFGQTGCRIHAAGKVYSVLRKITCEILGYRHPEVSLFKCCEKFAQ